MRGDCSAPAVAGLDPVDAARRLSKPMFRRVQLCDCCLHDLKGSAKINHQLILDRQPKAIKIAMIKAMVDGSGRDGAV